MPMLILCNMAIGTITSVDNGNQANDSELNSNTMVEAHRGKLTQQTSADSVAESNIFKDNAQEKCKVILLQKKRPLLNHV